MKPEEYVKPDECPACLNPLDCATGVGEKAKPQPDDLTVCINCQSFLQFDKDLNLVQLSDDEFDELPENIKGKLLSVRFLINVIKKPFRPTSGQNRPTH